MNKKNKTKQKPEIIYYYSYITIIFKCNYKKQLRSKKKKPKEKLVTNVPKIIIFFLFPGAVHRLSTHNSTQFYFVFIYDYLMPQSQIVG